MPQQELDWKVGDTYRTEKGDLMTISAIVPVETVEDVFTSPRGSGKVSNFIECREGDFPHMFDLTGEAQCCEHGDLVSRVTGSVKA